MTSKETVLQMWPDAHSYKWTGRWLIYKSVGLKDADIISDSCETESTAWDDAASRLEAAHGK